MSGVRLDEVLGWPARPGRPGTLAGAGLAVLGGLLWVLASPPIGWWPLGWIAALPTLWAIDRAPTARRAGLWGGLTAFTFTVGGFPWMLHLLQVNAHLPAPVAALGVIILGGVHALVYGLAARLIRGLRDRRRAQPRGPYPMAVVGALGFLVVEVVLWTPFPFSLAIGQADVDQVRRLSAVAGPAGITALMVGAAGTLFDAIAALEARRRSRHAPRVRIKPVAIYTLCFAFAVVGARRSTGAGPTRTITVGVVQPNERVDVPNTLRSSLEHLGALQRATADLEARGADLVVWSEAAFPFPLPRDLAADLPENNRYRLRRGFTIPVVIGAITALRDGTQWNSAVMLERDGRFTGRHDKIHRMIGSEYNPLIEWFPSAQKLMPAGAGSYAGGDRAHVLETTVDGVVLRLAVAVCLEDVLPDFGRELAALEPDLLINLTNDSWFGGAEPLQHEALARYRPVEIGVPMVRAVNTGPSSVIDRDGNFLARLDIRAGDHAPETLLADVTLGPRAHSWYAGWGGTAVKLVGWAGLLWWLLPALFAWIKGRRRAS